MASSLQGDMGSNSQEVKYILELGPIIPWSNHKFTTIDLDKSGFVLGVRVMSYFVADSMVMKK
jgi:hypothetical protein